MQKLLPPVLALIILALMALGHRYLPGARLLERLHTCWGLLPLVAGIGIAVAGRLQFRRAGTTVYTFDEPGRLVTGGVYRISRHPMYLGLALILLGAALLFGTVSPLVLAGAFVVVADRWYIAFEERAMASKFGDAYRDYAARVRRWL